MNLSTTPTNHPARQTDSAERCRLRYCQDFDVDGCTICLFRKEPRHLTKMAEKPLLMRVSDGGVFAEHLTRHLTKHLTIWAMGDR